jgi:hypothetical protein
MRPKQRHQRYDGEDVTMVKLMGMHGQAAALANKSAHDSIAFSTSCRQ